MRRLFLPVLMISLLAFPSLADNINVTAGAGTVMGTALIGGTNFPRDLVCDQAAPGTTCATVTGGNALKVDGSAVTQPVNGTVNTTPPANASTNVTQFGGNAVATGTGASGNGIPRVTLSNDSSLAANQSVNEAQVNGTTVSVNSGATDNGTQRTVLGNTQPTLTTTLAALEPTLTTTISGVTNTGSSLNVNVTGGSGGTSSAQGSTTVGEQLTPAGCATTSTPTTFTSGQTNMLTCGTDGTLRVSGGLAQASTTVGQLGDLVMAATTSTPAGFSSGTTNPLIQHPNGDLRVFADINPANQPTLTTTVSGSISCSNCTGAVAVAQGSATVGQQIFPQGMTVTSSPPVATVNNTWMPILDTQQRQIIALWADKGWMVRGNGSTGGTSSTTIIAANATNKIYITGIQCSSGTTSTLVTFNDTVNSTLFLPGGGGSNAVYETPLVGQATNQAFQFTPSVTSTNSVCNAQGFLGG